MPAGDDANISKSLAAYFGVAVCRRRRPDDIPGHRNPAVYADYVRTVFERDMDKVLYHNALDLVTLFDLALRLAA